MRDIIIKADHVSMRFNLASEKVDNMKEYFIRRLKRKVNTDDEFWALQDVSFQIENDSRSLETHEGESDYKWKHCADDRTGGGIRYGSDGKGKRVFKRRDSGL